MNQNDEKSLKPNLAQCLHNAQSDADDDGLRLLGVISST